MSRPALKLCSERACRRRVDVTAGLQTLSNVRRDLLREMDFSCGHLQAIRGHNVTVEEGAISDEVINSNSSDSVMEKEDLSEIFDFNDVNINRLIKPPHNDSLDLVSIQNDISVLSIYSLSQAICELIAQGPKETPGMTLTDWIIVSRYFTSAATLSIAWVAAGIMLNQFQKNSWHVLEHEETRLKLAFRCWLVAMPLHQVLCTVGGVQHSMVYTLSELFGSLGVILLWRKVEPFLY